MVNVSALHVMAQTCCCGIGLEDGNQTIYMAHICDLYGIKYVRVDGREMAFDKASDHLIMYYMAHTWEQWHSRKLPYLSASSCQGPVEGSPAKNVRV